MTATLLVLALTSLGATVNGAIGYGYSSISVPIGLFAIVDTRLLWTFFRQARRPAVEDMLRVAA